MPEPESPLSLGLSKPPASSLPPAEELQFDRAQPLSSAAGAQPVRICLACKQSIGEEYYHAQGQVICPLCANRIEAGQQEPPSSSLVPAVLYGAGTALAGCALYALVAIATGLEIGLIAIVVGMMVGKAIRYASHGLGGRRQQILAVVLTYLGITTSYLPVFIYQVNKNPAQFQKQNAAKTGSAGTTQAPSDTSDSPAKMSRGVALAYLFALVLAAPIMQLFSNPVGGGITLLIIYIGLRQAWRLTGRTELAITGPYRASEA
jgi:hypothetical protein